MDTSTLQSTWRTQKPLCTHFFPLCTIHDFIPEKAHILLYGLPSVLLSVFWVWFSPLFLLLQAMSDFKGLFFHVLHPQDHVSQQLVLRPKSKRSCALFWTSEIFLRIQMKIHSFRSRTKKSNPSGPKNLSIEFLNYIRFWWPCSKSSSSERYSTNWTNRVTRLECFHYTEGQNSECAKRMTTKERSKRGKKTTQQQNPQQT